MVYLELKMQKWRKRLSLGCLLCILLPVAFVAVQKYAIDKCGDAEHLVIPWTLLKDGIFNTTFFMLIVGTIAFHGFSV